MWLERPGDQARGHAATPQLAGDALAAPLLQLALVVGEAPRVACVVQQLRLGQLRDRVVDGGRIDPLTLEDGPQLGDGAVTPSDGRVGQAERPLQLGLLVEIAQAARSSGRSPPSASPASSAGCTAASGTATGSTPRISYTFCSISRATAGFSRR